MAVAAKPVELAEIAAHLGRAVEGNAGLLISGMAALDTAGPGDLAFVRSPRHSAAVAASRAGALILPPGLDSGARPVIRSTDPAADFASVLARFAPARSAEPGLHPSAVVAPGVRIDPSASIGPGVVIGAGCRVGARTILHANVTLYEDVVVGSDSTLHAGVVVREACEIGSRVLLQPGVVIGGDGFGYVGGGDGRPRRMPHVGRVVIEDDVEIGANTTIDRATLEETRIRRGAKIDNLVMIAHNCDVGEGAIVVAQSGLSGSTRVGEGAMLMARVGSAGHLEIGAGAFVGARSGLHHDVAPGARVFGSPALEERRWHRVVAAMTRLPDVLRRLRAVERKLATGSAPDPEPQGEGEEPRAR